MALNQKFNPFRYAIIGTIAGFLSYLVSFMISFFHIPTAFIDGKWIQVTASTVHIDLRTQVLESGYFKKLGLKIIDFLTGKLGIDIWNIVGIIIGTITIVIIGRLIYGYLVKREKGWMMQTRVFFSFVLGSALFGLFIPFIFKIDFITTFISMLVYAIILGTTMQIFVNVKNLSWVTE